MSPNIDSITQYTHQVDVAVDKEQQIIRLSNILIINCWLFENEFLRFY